MTPGERAGIFLKRTLLGQTFPQQCTVGMPDPQDEIAVQLHGLGPPIDVSANHTLACAAPFRIAIGSCPGVDLASTAARVSLHFRERAGRQRLLGTLGLQNAGAVRMEEQAVQCFSVRKRGNYCLPRARLWARYAYWAIRRWRRPPDVAVSGGDVQAMAIFFICPRPVALVSVGDERAGNLFPMNLMGALGDGYFGFALNHTRPAAALVERAGRIALSSVPVELAPAVRQLGRNHKRERIDWGELPFPTSRSAELGLTVPSCALRVREAELLATRKMGSHTLFLARILRDERWHDGLQFCMVHGIYQECRGHE